MWLLAAIALTTGVLDIQAEYGATVSVDRQPRGVAPVGPVAVAPGLHLVEVWRRGALPWTRLVFVAAGDRVVLRVGPLHAPPAAAPSASARPGAPAPPAWRIAATAGLALASADEGQDLDLVQRWHVTSERPFGPRSRVAFSVLGRTDVAGSTRLLRRRPTDRDLTLVEAAVGGALGPVEASAGRLLGQGPAQTLLVLDGGRAEVPVGPLTLAGLAGVRADPGSARPADPATAGLGLRLGDGPWAAGVAATYQARPHLEATARGGADAWRADARATLVGAGELLQTRADVALPPAGLSAHHRYVGRARSPFTDLRPDLGVVRALAPGHEVGATLDATTVRADLAARLADHRALLGLVGARRDPLGVELSGYLADGGPVRGRLLLALDATGHLGATRLRARVGLGALDVEADTRVRRVLPEGAGDVEVPLAAGLSLAASAGLQAVHPTILPGGGPLATARLELRLR